MEGGSSLPMTLVLILGFCIGTGLSFGGGLGFFVMVYLAMLRGIRSALAFAGGIWLSDGLFAWLVYMGVRWLKPLARSLWFQIGFALLFVVVGASFLWGVWYRRRRQQRRKSSRMARRYSSASGVTTTVTSSSSALSVSTISSSGSSASSFLLRPSTLFFEGFLVNSLNPGVIFLWFALATMGIQLSGHVEPEWLISILLGVIAGDVLKIWGSRKVARFLKPRYFRYLRVLRVVVGVVLVVVGVVLLVRSLVRHLSL